MGRETIFAHQHLLKPESNKKERMGRMLYWLAKLICMGFFSTGLIPIKVIGREYLKGIRACIVAADHVDGIDSPVLIWSLPFTTWFLLRDDFGEPIKSLLVRLLLMVQINRENPKPSQLRNAVQLLRSGKRLAMYPEGHRSKLGELQQAKSGLGLLIRLSGVPVVPVSISGTFSFLRKETWKREIFRAILRRRPSIVVVIHKPLYLESAGREDDEEITTKIMIQIASGLREEDRGFYREKADEGGKTP